MNGPWSQRWRQALAAAGAALGLLPLIQGDWKDAPFAAVAGLLVAGLWAGATDCGPRLGSAVGAGLVAAMAAGFAVSQWPREHLLRPPAWDDVPLWAAVAAAAVLALVVEAACRGRLRAGIVALNVFLLLVVSAPAAGVAWFVVAVDPTWKVQRFEALDREILPLPATLRLVSDRRCAGSGSSGNCTAEFVVTAADGIGKDVVIQRLAEHLGKIGWTMDDVGGRPRGRFDVGGVLPWRAHTLWFADEAWAYRPTPAGAVVVYIDNM